DHRNHNSAFSHPTSKLDPGTRVSSEGLGLLDFMSFPSPWEMTACAYLDPDLLLFLCCVAHAF
uniref:Uncharacterized protein n=1 Tax=Peromyscus maniculatus bairdii TaxID=230844 RepID=A0A8C8W1J3_PERMB